MDYSASINEAEDPAVSPWGSSPAASPRASRTGFSALTGDPPSSPFRANSQTSNGPGLAGGPADDPQRPGTATTASETGESTTLDADESQPQSGVQSPQPASGIAPTQPGQQEAAERPRKPAGPQYKLQAKITGLERTGKKDPILRFDVHVRQNYLEQRKQASYTDYRRQISPDSVLPNTVMFAAFTPNSSSSPSTSSPRTPRPSCLLYLRR